jgi:hypothetical protein
MLTFPAAVTTMLAARSGVFTRQMLWLNARNRATGAAEAIGFWTGDDHQEFVIGAATRLYFGAGTILGIDAIIQQTGIVVRMLNVTLSPLSAEVALAIRGYDPRLGRAEIHQGFFSTDTGVLLAEPTRVFKGFINSTPIMTPQIGGQASAALVLASNSQSLTRVAPLKKSDQSQRLRGNDRFFQYADVSGSVPYVWGENIEGRAGNSAQPPPTPRPEPRGSDR